MNAWLRPNKRALSLGMIPPGLLTLTGAILAIAYDFAAARITGGLIAAVGASLLLYLAWQMGVPRLACEAGQLLVYLRGGRPIRVPLEIVECFLLGQAPTLLPGKQHEHVETSSVVIRLSETAADWRHRDVKPALGKWCDGYITLRGTWCEPLDVRTVNRLNAQLAEAHRALKDAQVAS